MRQPVTLIWDSIILDLLIRRKSGTSTLPRLVIRHIAVRETILSRHHGGPIKGPPETPRITTTLPY